jgi:hypothetical protein
MLITMNPCTKWWQNLHYIQYRLHLEPGRTKQKTNSVAFSPQANYTDWATATCPRNLVPTFVDRGVSRGQRGRSPTVINLSFLDRNQKELSA